MPVAVKSITAVNAIFALSIPGLYDTPQVLQGYSADAAFDTAPATAAEVVIGVDGIMSSGFTPFTVDQDISLMPNSPSAIIFETWMEAQTVQQSTLPCNATIILPAVSRKYTLTNGVLMSIPMIASVRKVLQARQFRITWNRVSPAAA